MEQESEAKKLRSSEPDLKVVLGKGESQSVEWYHSQNLACKSKYIDAMLTAPMKEKEERTISFPDIDSETWQKMLDFLDNPLAARKMSARDAMELAPWYDKYEFGLGRELCEEVMSEFLSTQSLNKEVQKHSLDIEFVIDLVKVPMIPTWELHSSAAWFLSSTKWTPVGLLHLIISCSRKSAWQSWHLYSFMHATMPKSSGSVQDIPSSPGISSPGIRALSH
ncbi:hypothetical protein ACHAWF_010686 [Thalassiosira exigua]